jgi:hypothetical protein
MATFTPQNALPQIPAIQRAVDPETGKISAEWLRWLNLLKQRADYLSVEGIIDGRTIIDGTITVETLPALSAMAGQITYAQLPTGAGTWNAAPTITGDLTISANLLPSNTDASDLGSTSKAFRRGYISEINAVLFSKQTQQLYGGWLAVSKNAGTFAQAVASADTVIDFGQAMTANQFVLVRAVDSGGVISEEYMKVGALAWSTSYNVTRNLSGAGAKNWPVNTPYQVRGVAGDGWIELNAFDTPRMSVFSQGSAYNNSTELIRIGHLTGMPNSSSGIGIYAGDATNYFRWDGTALTLISAGCTIDASGITLGTPTAFTSSSALKFRRVTTGGFGQTGDVNALHAEAQIGSPYTTFITLENTIKGTSGGSGGSDGEAQVGMSASGWNIAGAGSSRATASIYVQSLMTGSACSITAAATNLSGTLSVGGGQIAFPAAQNASANANTLDDYEEGTWTPALLFGGSAVGITYSNQVGVYVKVGQHVHVEYTVTLTSKGAAVGAATVSGLPFFTSAVPTAAIDFVGGAGLTSTPYFAASGTSMFFVIVDGASNRVQLTNANFTNTTTFQGSLDFKTAT